MESVLAAKGNAKLGDTSMKPIITAIKLRIPLKTIIQHPGKSLGKRIADSDPSAPKGHRMAEVNIGGVGLRWSSDIDHLPPIVLRENGDEVIGTHDGIVVAEQEPPHVAVAESECLQYDSRDAEARGVAGGICVSEARYVVGNAERRKGGRGVERLPDVIVKPDVAARHARPPPQANELSPARPEVGGAGDAEDDVI